MMFATFLCIVTVCVCSSLVVAAVVDRYIRVHLLFLEREREREKEIPRILCVVMSSCCFVRLVIFFVLFICVRPKVISVCGNYNFLSFFLN